MTRYRSADGDLENRIDERRRGHGRHTPEFPSQDPAKDTYTATGRIKSAEDGERAGGAALAA
ncbi:MAG: hypothetical protein INF92_10870 [Rhodobacter sp.]|jgi:hypothetical protein|nr:hypothetical protein [Rhodobacter sp.]